MSCLTLAFHDVRRGGLPYTVLPVGEKPPWWGAGIYREQNPCEHEDVGLGFYAKVRYDALLLSRNAYIKSYDKAVETSVRVVPEFHDRALQYLTDLHSLSKSLTAYITEKERENDQQAQLEGYRFYREGDYVAHRAKLSRVFSEMGVVMFNVALLHHTKSYAARLSATDAPPEESRLQGELCGGIFDYLSTDLSTVKPILAEFNKNHLNALSHIILAESLEPEVQYYSIAKADPRRCTMACTEVINGYFRAYSTLTKEDYFAGAQGELRTAMEVQRSLLLTFVQLKRLYYKALRQSSRAFLNEFFTRKKQLRRKSYRNFESLIDLSHSIIPDNHALRDEAKVFLYELSLLLKRNRELEMPSAEKEAETLRPPVPRATEWLELISSERLAHCTLPVKAFESSQQHVYKEMPVYSGSLVPMKNTGTYVGDYLTATVHIPPLDLYAKEIPNGQQHHTINASFALNTPPLIEEKCPIIFCLVVDCYGLLSTEILGINRNDYMKDFVKQLMLHSGLGESDWGAIVGPKGTCNIHSMGVAGMNDLLSDIEGLAPSSQSIIDGLMRAHTTLGNFNVKGVKKEIVLITDGYDCNAKQHWRNWQMWHEFKKLMVQGQEQNATIPVSCCCIGDTSDKYLSKAIVGASRGDFAYYDNNAEGLIGATRWFRKRIMEQSTKLASDVKLRITCCADVKLRLYDNFDLHNSENIILGVGERPVPPVSRTGKRRNRFRNSRSSVRGGRSFRTGSTKMKDVVEFTRLDGEVVWVDKDDIDKYVKPIQRCWRGFKARKTFARMVDSMMQEVADERERSKKIELLMKIAERHVGRKGPIVYDDDNEFKRSEQTFVLQDMSAGHRTNIPVQFEIRSRALNPWNVEVATAVIEYVDYAGETQSHTIQVNIKPWEFTFHKTTHAWNRRAYIHDVKGTVFIQPQPSDEKAFYACTGDWLEVNDTVLTAESSSCQLILVDGTRINLDPLSEVTFQSYHEGQSVSEWQLHVGGLLAVTGSAARATVECPIVDETAEETLLVPPTYQTVMNPSTCCRVNWAKLRLNVNCALGACVVLNNGKTVDVLPLMQTIAREGNPVAAAWTIESTDYDEWIEKCPLVAETVATQAAIQRSIIANAFNRIAECIRRNSSRKTSDDVGNMRAREIIVAHYLSGMKSFAMHTLAQFTDIALLTLRLHAKVEYTCSTRPSSGEMRTYFMLIDVCRTVQHERSRGSCDSFMTFQQREAIAKSENGSQKKLEEQIALYAMKAQKDSEIKRREEEVLQLFPLWDMDESGSVEFAELQQVVLSWAYSKRRDAKRFLQKWERAMSHKLVAVQLDSTQLCELVLYLSEDYEADQFNTLVAHIRVVLQVLDDLTEKTRTSRSIWNLFQWWDKNGLGYVDSEDMLRVFEEVVPFGEYTNMLRLRDYFDSVSSEVISGAPLEIGIDDLDEEGEPLLRGFPLLLATFKEALIECSSPEIPEERFHQGIWVLREALSRTRQSVISAATNTWKGDVEGNEMQHLITWDLRHMFDGVNGKEIAAILNPKAPFYSLDEPTQQKPPCKLSDIKQIAVCILTLAGINPPLYNRRSRFFVSHDAYWNTLLNQLKDGKWRSFFDFLMTFPLTSITKRIILLVLPHLSSPIFDETLMLHPRIGCPVLGYLIRWVQCVVRISMLLNRWTFSSSHGSSLQAHGAGVHSARYYSVKDGKLTRVDGTEVDPTESILIRTQSAVDEQKSPRPGSGTKYNGIHNVRQGQVVVKAVPLQFSVTHETAAQTALRRCVLHTPTVPMMSSSYSSKRSIILQPPVVEEYQRLSSAPKRLQHTSAENTSPRRHGAPVHPSIVPPKRRTPRLDMLLQQENSQEGEESLLTFKSPKKDAAAGAALSASRKINSISGGVAAQSPAAPTTPDRPPSRQAPRQRY